MCVRGMEERYQSTVSHRQARKEQKTRATAPVGGIAAKKLLAEEYYKLGEAYGKRQREQAWEYRPQGAEANSASNSMSNAPEGCLAYCC